AGEGVGEQVGAGEHHRARASGRGLHAGRVGAVGEAVLGDGDRGVDAVVACQPLLLVAGRAGRAARGGAAGRRTPPATAGAGRGGGTRRTRGAGRAARTAGQRRAVTVVAGHDVHGRRVGTGRVRDRARAGHVDRDREAARVAVGETGLGAGDDASRGRATAP